VAENKPAQNQPQTPSISHPQSQPQPLTQPQISPQSFQNSSKLPTQPQVQTTTSNQPTPPAPQTTQPISKKPKYLILLISLIIITIIGVAFFFIYKHLSFDANVTTPNPKAVNVIPTTTTPKYILPPGFSLVTENKKVETEGGYYYETRFSNSKGNNIVVMKLQKVELCKEPVNSTLIRDYQRVMVNNYEGCQLVLLDEETNKEKARSIRWTTEANSYTLLSYELSLSFQELIKIAEQIR